MDENEKVFGRIIEAPKTEPIKKGISLKPGMADMANVLNASIQMKSTSSDICESFKKLFSDFEKTLDDSQEIGIALSSFGIKREIIVEKIESVYPNAIIIRGIEDQNTVFLFQHISQISFLLVPVKKETPDAPRRKIGFGSE